MIRRLREAHGSEDGAALIFAIAFMILVGAISAGLMTFLMTSVGHRAPLDRVRDRQYAADGAIEVAVAAVRVLPAPGPAQATCAPAAGYYESTLNGVHVRVDCQNAFSFIFNGGLLEQRNVVFTACEFVAGQSCSDANVNVIARAQVNYQRTGDGTVTATYVQSWSVNQ